MMMILKMLMICNAISLKNDPCLYYIYYRAANFKVVVEELSSEEEIPSLRPGDSFNFDENFGDDSTT